MNSDTTAVVIRDIRQSWFQVFYGEEYYDVERMEAMENGSVGWLVYQQSPYKVIDNDSDCGRRIIDTCVTALKAQPVKNS